MLEESVCAISKNNNVIIVNEKFLDFVEEHKEEMKKAKEMHIARAEILKKNRIE